VQLYRDMLVRLQLTYCCETRQLFPNQFRRPNKLDDRLSSDFAGANPFHTDSESAPIGAYSKCCR
jgi:hypothetical protein